MLNPGAKLARSGLFQKTVLAALVSIGGTAEVGELIEPLRQLLPEEGDLQSGQLAAALGDLVAQGHCKRVGAKFEVTPESMGTVLKYFSLTSAAFSGILEAAVASCMATKRLSDAQLGYLERNVRAALLHLFRALGPMNPSEATMSGELRADIAEILSRDLDQGTARHALSGIAGFMERKENEEHLSVFSRSYGALALRNIDPIGRRWQKAVLDRSTIALDTDVVLTLLVEELPENRSLVESLRGLAGAGCRIVIADHVLAEACTNISRAGVTYKKFETSLGRLPSALVDVNVWNVVVRGFYYARKSGSSVSWSQYWSRYFDDRHPEQYLKFLLSKRVSSTSEELQSIPPDWDQDFFELSGYLLEKERGRFKAQFRDEQDMEERTKRDVRMAMHLAVPSAGIVSKAHGYLLSLDSAFRRLEAHANWRDRARVYQHSKSVSYLASMICGVQLHSSDLARILVDPIACAAAQLMDEEISTLAKIGVDGSARLGLGQGP